MVLRKIIMTLLRFIVWKLKQLSSRISEQTQNLILLVRQNDKLKLKCRVFEPSLIQMGNAGLVERIETSIWKLRFWTSIFDHDSKESFWAMGKIMLIVLERYMCTVSVHTVIFLDIQLTFDGTWVATVGRNALSHIFWKLYSDHPKLDTPWWHITTTTRSYISIDSTLGCSWVHLNCG